MKKILIAILTAVVLTSCGSVKPTTSDRMVLSSVVNYQKYSEEGFLITPFEYTADYEAIGEMEILIIPAKVKNQGARTVNFESKTAGSTTTYIAQENISKQEMTNIAVAKAKELGANAIAGFKIEKKYYYLQSQYNNDVYYVVSGLCIMR